MLAVSSRNKVMSLEIPDHSRIQGNYDADALAREGAIPISPCVSRLRVQGWLWEKRLQHCAAAPSMKQLKLLLKLPVELLVLGRTLCIQAEPAYYPLLCGTSPAEIYVLCHCPALARHKLGSPRPSMVTDIKRPSVRIVLPLILWSGLFNGL
jgi:hypothetical protein